jgi:DNA-binding MarR family transcriptional regulator
VTATRSSRAKTKRPKLSSRRSSDGLRGHDYQALARLEYQLRKCLSLGEVAARRRKLTPQQHQTLLAIKGFSRELPISVGELATLLLVRHHTAVERMDRLSKLGLIDRAPDPDNARRVLVRLTPEGNRHLRRLSKIHAEQLSLAKSVLTGILKDIDRCTERNPGSSRLPSRLRGRAAFT